LCDQVQVLGPVVDGRPSVNFAADLPARPKRGHGRRPCAAKCKFWGPSVDGRPSVNFASGLAVGRKKSVKVGGQWRLVVGGLVKRWVCGWVVSGSWLRVGWSLSFPVLFPFSFFLPFPFSSGRSSGKGQGQGVSLPACGLVLHNHLNVNSSPVPHLALKFRP